MPDIKMPDGKVVRFPDTMSKEEIHAAIVKKFPELDKAAGASDAVEIGPGHAAAAGVDAAQPAQGEAAPAEQPSPEAMNTLAKGQTGWLGPLAPMVNAAIDTFGAGNIASFSNTLGDVASFGTAPAIQRTVKNAFSPGSGDALQQQIDTANQENPGGAIAGTLAAIPVGMALTGGVGEALAAPLQATRAAPAVNAFLRGGGAGGNLARMAATGATAGGVEAAAHGGGFDEIATGALTGGALGPVAGIVAPVVVGAAKRLVVGPGAKAWRYLAKKMEVNPDTVQGYVDAFTQRTGRQPSIQQVMTDHDSGVLAQFGEIQPHAGQVLRQGANTTGATTGSTAATLPNAPTLLQSVAPGDASVTTLLNARDAATDTAVNAIRANPVTLPSWLVDDIARSPALTSRKWTPVRDRISQGTATIDDIDKLRKQLTKINSNEFSTDIDELLTDLRANTPPEYSQIMDDYAAASRYIDAIDMGASGTDLNHVLNAGKRHTLNTPEGIAGLDIGQAMREAHVSARTGAPGSLRPSEEGGAAGNLGTAAADIVVGAKISGARQAMMAVTKIAQGLNLPPALQRQIAEGFTSTDPAVRTATLDRLRRAHISLANIERLKLAASGAGGVVASETVTGSEPFETAVGVQ